jgi:uncharacterized iron-regulated membrane protein
VGRGIGPLLLPLHRWSGLLIALVVVVVGLTGAITTYQDELDRSLNDDLFRVQRLPGPVRPLDELVQAAERSGAGLLASSVRLPQSHRDSIEVSVAPRAGSDFDGWYVYVDPYRARVLGQRPFAPDPWSRRGIVASLYEVHYSLAASRAGVWFVSVVAGVWILTLLLGVAQSWPQTRPAWRRALRIRFGGSPAQLKLDLHRTTGLVAALFIAAVLASGIALNLSPQATALLQAFSPLTSEPLLPARSRTGFQNAIGWQAALDAAAGSEPDARPYSMYLDGTRDVYVVRLREAGAIHRRGQTRVYVDAADARVLRAWNPREGSAGDRFWSWQNPLHSGHAFGGAGRLVVCLAGLAAVLLACTGVPLWWSRRQARRC